MIENTISIDGTEVLKAPVNADAEETKVHNENISAAEAETDENGDAAELETAGAEAGNTPENTADQPEMMVELNLYGEKVQVPLSQAVAQAQKGMAFEHMKNQLAAAKNDARLSTLQTIAGRSGKTTAQLVMDMHSDFVADNLARRYGSVANAPLDEVAKAVSEIEDCRRQIQRSEAEMQHNDWKAQLMEFISHNPGCRDIPESVLDAAKQGEKISDAYSRFYGNKINEELTEAKREIEMLRSQQKAAKNSTPSAADVGASKPKENEFLKLMKSTW